MIKQSVIFIISLTFIAINVNAQSPYNQFDTDGERHGIWKKNFKDSKQLRYQGEFKHGKEMGLFKFYKLVRKKSVLSATKVFNEANSVAEVTFLASTGEVISKGNMDGRIYIGEWLYYHKNSDKIMTKEYYNDAGELDGIKTIYFENGERAEQMSYLNGKKEGNAKHFSENGALLKDFNYKDGVLHGAYKDYTPKGELIVEGQFKHGKKHGYWKFYEKGELLKEKNYSDPKTFHKN